MYMDFTCTAQCTCCASLCGNEAVLLLGRVVSVQACACVSWVSVHVCVCVNLQPPLPSQVEYLARCNHCHQAIRDKTWHVYKDLAYHHGCVMRACVSAHACSCLPAVRVRSSQGHSLYGLKDCHAGVSSAQNVDGPRERPSTQTPKKLSSAKLAFDWRSQAALTASRWRQSIQKAHGCGHLCEKIRNTQHPHPPLRSRMSVFRRNLRRPS